MATDLDLAPAARAQGQVIDRIVVRLVAALRTLFVELDKYNPAAVARFERDSAHLTYEAQRVAAGGTSAYLDAVLRAMDIEPPRRPGALPKDLRGIPQARVAERQVIQYRWLLSDAYAEQLRTEWLERQPIEPPSFVLEPQQAEDQVLQRIDSNAHDDVRLAERQAADEILRAAGVTQYRRVIHPELSKSGTCGMCIVAADRKYKVGNLMPIHDNCKCTIAPIKGDDDPGDRLNQSDLRRLYKDADGNDRQSLKRTRYRIDEHGELGPVLVPTRRNKRRTK